MVSGAALGGSPKRKFHQNDLGIILAVEISERCKLKTKVRRTLFNRVVFLTGNSYTGLLTMGTLASNQ